MNGTGRRDFINELDNPISLFVLAGSAGRNLSSRVCIKGPISTLEANMTRMELEQLRDALNEALGQDAAVTNILDLAHA